MYGLYHINHMPEWSEETLLATFDTFLAAEYMKKEARKKWPKEPFVVQEYNHVVHNPLNINDLHKET